LSLYTHVCCPNDHVTLSYDTQDDPEFDAWLKKFYQDPENTALYDEAMIRKVAEELYAGVEKGFGKSLADIDYNTPDAEMLRALRENVYIFSAYKNHQQLLEVSSKLVDEAGKLREFAAFKREATKVNQVFNQRYLRVEYNSAVAQGQMASRWMEVEATKDELPYLTVLTVGDANVRPAHQAINGLTLPADHSYWKTHWPPFDWECRCDVIQSKNKKVTPDEKIVYLQVPDTFKGNVGIDKKVFKDHPYFKEVDNDTKNELEILAKKLNKDE